MTVASRELPVMLHQACLLLSSSLRFVTGVIRAHRGANKIRWRSITACQQALMTLVYLHKGGTYACAAAGFGVPTSTVYRRVNETISPGSGPCAELEEGVAEGETPWSVLFDPRCDVDPL